MPWTRPTKVELQSLELKSLQLLATADVLLAKHVTSKVCWYTWPSHFEKGRSIEAGIPKNPSNINPTASNVFRSMMKYAFDIVWPLEEEVLRLSDLSVKSLSQIMWVLNVHFAHFTHSAFVGSKTVRRIPPCFRGTAALWGCTARVAARFEQDFKFSDGFECASTIQFNLFL